MSVNSRDLQQHKLPVFPEFFISNKISKEQANYNQGKYSEEQIIWMQWNFYHRLKISTLFIYKFLDNPLVTNLVDDYAKSQINLATSTIQLPTLFFPGDDSQTAAIIFVEPAKTFFLQYLVTSDVDLEKFAQVLNAIFTVDENNNFTKIKNHTLLVQLISELNHISKFFKKTLDSMQASLIYADTKDPGDDLHFYVKLFKQYVLNNGLTTYMHTHAEAKRITDEYNQDLSQLKATCSDDSDSDVEEGVFETGANGELVGTKESMISATKAIFRAELEDFFYELLNTQISIFHTFKKNLGLPGSIEHEIISFLAEYDKKRNIKYAAREHDKKTKEELQTERDAFIAKYTDDAMMRTYFNQAQSLDEFDPERIRISRDIYYEVRETLHCIFYIFKHLDKRMLINRFDKLNEIIAEIDKKEGRYAAKKQPVVAKPKSDHAAEVAEITRLIKERKAKQAKKSEERKEQAKTSASSPVNSKTVAAVLPSPPKVIDLKAEFEEGFAECIAKQELLEEQCNEFEAKHEKIYPALGTLKNSDVLDKKLAELNTSVSTDIINKKNSMKGQVNKIFEKREQTLDWQIKLAKWKKDLDSLLVSINSKLKKLTEIDNLRIKLEQPRVRNKKPKGTAKIQATKLLRARTASENVPRPPAGNIAPVALSRRSSEGNMVGVAIDSPKPFRAESATPGSTPVPTPEPSPSLSPALSSPRSSKVYEIKDEEDKSPSHEVKRSILSPYAKPFVPSMFFSANDSRPPNLPPLIIDEAEDVSITLEPLQISHGESSGFDPAELSDIKQAQAIAVAASQQSLNEVNEEADAADLEQLLEEEDQLLNECVKHFEDLEDEEEEKALEQVEEKSGESTIPLSLFFVPGPYSQVIEKSELDKAAQVPGDWLLGNIGNGWLDAHLESNAKELDVAGKPVLRL
jgi:hypothetical protein